MHVVFEKDASVYKVLKSVFGTDKDIKRFEFEKNMLVLLANYGIPTPNVEHIYAPGELIPDYCVLVETKCPGLVYDSENLKPKHIAAIWSVLNITHGIDLDFFGPIAVPELQTQTWQEYMGYLFDRAHEIKESIHIDIDIEPVQQYFTNTYRYEDKAKLLILDPNEKNYIFDNNDTLIGLVDIDHPIGFDPLYDIVSFLYSRPNTFQLMKQAGLVQEKEMTTIINYAIIYMLFDLWFRYDKNHCKIDTKLEYYINKAKLFTQNLKDML